MIKTLITIDIPTNKTSNFFHSLCGDTIMITQTPLPNNPINHFSSIQLLLSPRPAFKTSALCYLPRMQKSSSRRAAKNNKQNLIRGGPSCNAAALCCSSCRLSVSSSASSDDPGGRFPAISSLSHAMVQERLEQMIREREEVSRRLQRRHGSSSNSSSGGGNNNSSKLILMVAMEKCSYDPREDFRESIRQMIVANRIWEPKDLRRLLNCYVSMNSEESREVILEAFHDVCSTLFLSCKYHGS